MAAFSLARKAAELRGAHKFLSQLLPLQLELNNTYVGVESCGEASIVECTHPCTRPCLILNQTSLQHLLSQQR